MKQIPLSGKNGSGKFAIVYNSDFKRLSKFTWYVRKSGKTEYAYSARINGNRKDMAVMLMKPARGFVVDHKNGNGLDNRRSNLRVCTKQQNKANSGPQINGKSGYKGVHIDKNGRIYASLQFMKKTILIGRFKTAERAARAYDINALIAFGDYAYLNFPEKKPSYKRTLALFNATVLQRRFNNLR